MRALQPLLVPVWLVACLGTGLLCILLVSGGSVANAESVVVVAREGQIRALRNEQIADIFLGRMHRLPDGARVTPIDQLEGSATRDAFYSSFTGRSPAQIKAHWARIIFTGRGEPPAQVASCEDVKKLVSSDLRAIGYIERSAVDDTVLVLNSP